MIDYLQDAIGYYRLCFLTFVEQLRTLPDIGKLSASYILHSRTT